MVLLTRNKRIVVRIILALVIMAGVAAFIYYLAIPQTKKETDTLYQSELQPGITYEVKLIDNDIFSDTVLPEEQVYIKSMIDQIKVTFDANYQVSDQADITMEYEVKAKITGFNSGNEQRTDYWSKEFSVVEKTSDHTASNILQKQESFNLSLKDYDDFAQHANDVTGVNLSSELVVSMIGTIMAQTPGGPLETPLNVNITLPLNGGDFSITKGDLQPITKQITEDKVTTLPLNVPRLVLIGVATVLLLTTFIASFFVLREPMQSDIIHKEVDKIIKNYGSRMVSLRYKSTRNQGLQYEVSAIKDLMILSDEIRKPIYYIKDEDDLAKDSSFYVDDGNDTYYFKVQSKYDPYMHSDSVDYLDALTE